MNKIGFVLSCWSCAKSDSEGKVALLDFMHKIGFVLSCLSCAKSDAEGKVALLA